MQYLDDLPADPLESISELFSILYKDRSDYYTQSTCINSNKVALVGMIINAIGRISLSVTNAEGIYEICDKFYDAVSGTRNLSYDAFERYLASLGSMIQNLKLSNYVSLEVKNLEFELEPNEKLKVMKLAEQMRAIVTLSDHFDDDHKNRLLRRISAIEYEVNKNKGKFDVVLGGIVEFGDALGQFGDKVQPLVDRIQEIRGITQRKTSEYDKLPEPEKTKRLPAPD